MPHAPKPLSLAEIAALVGGQVDGATGNPAGCMIAGVSSLEDAGPEHISFLANKRYLPDLGTTRAGAVLIDRDTPRTSTAAFVRVADPSLALVAIVKHFAPSRPSPPEGIHPTAVIDRTASVGAEARIGPFAVVEAGARIGERCWLGAHSYVGHETTLGPGCEIGPNVVLRERISLGARVIVQASTVVGSDGFGYLFIDGAHRPIPQLGTVRIEDDVELGAGCTIDRARFGETVIGQGTKVDNQVHVGHNVRIGRHALVIAQTGIAGSARIGNYCVLAGQSGIDGHVVMGDGSRVAGKSGVTRDVSPGATIAGIHGQEVREFMRQEHAMKRLPKLLARIDELERRLGELEAQAADDQARR